MFVSLHEDRDKKRETFSHLNLSFNQVWDPLKYTGEQAWAVQVYLRSLLRTLACVVFIRPFHQKGGVRWGGFFSSPHSPSYLWWKQHVEIRLYYYCMQVNYLKLHALHLEFAKRVSFVGTWIIQPLPFAYWMHHTYNKHTYKQSLIGQYHTQYLLSSSSLPPRSGLSVGDIHSKWLCFWRWRAKKRSAANSVESDGTFPTGTWKYWASSSCVCWQITRHLLFHWAH